MRTFRILYWALALLLLAMVMSAEAASIKVKVINRHPTLFTTVGVICTFELPDSALVPAVHIFFKDSDGFKLGAIDLSAWTDRDDNPERFTWADGVCTYTYTYTFQTEVADQVVSFGFKATGR